MKKYFQASKGYLVDTDTWELVENIYRENPCLVDVPFYYWHYPESSRHFVVLRVGMPADEFKKTSQVRLNNLIVKHHQGYAKVCIQYDEPGVGWKRIELRCHQRSGAWIPNKGSQPCGADYRMTIDGVEKEIYSGFTDQVTAEIRFQTVPGLDYREIMGCDGDKLSLGLYEKQYEVMYRGRLLQGRSYALLCGYWGILLSDKFEFDSLVFLDGVSKHTLYVERFARTVNPYVIKLMTLLR